MTDRELMQMALNALEHYKSPDSTIKALRARLAQPELPLVRVEEFVELIKGNEGIFGRPVMRTEWPTEEKPWVKTYSGGKPNYTQPIEPEPVAWGVDEGEGRCISLHDLYFVKEDADHMAELKGTHAKVVALYTAPPKKEWVELTKEECFELCVKHKDAPFSLLVAVQAKLKEKNA